MHSKPKNGIVQLLNELKPLGQIIIRRAYGVWSRPQLARHQKMLNQQGFEMIHCYHPVSGKNTADIQMTVDVIEFAWHQPLITGFVLVTGDSDFSPVFRRLREMNKEVIGVGCHSALSESVKTSCTRFIYTDSPPIQSITVPPVQNSKISSASSIELQKVKDLVKQQLSQSDQAVNASLIKSQILLKQPKFKEKEFGFASFTDFLKSIDGVEIEKVGTIRYAKLKPVPSQSVQTIQTAEGYRNVLKKFHLTRFDADSFKTVYKKAIANKTPCADMAALRTAVFNACLTTDSKWTKSMINQVFTVFIKLDLVHNTAQKSNTPCFKVKKTTLKDFLLRLDQLIISTLIELSKTTDLELKTKEIKKITLSSISKDDIKKQIELG